MHGLGSNTEDQVPYSTKEISSSTALVIPTTAPEPVIDTAEEEGVCRICLVEDGRVMRMECKCKGGVALAHPQCALKWFGIKGNKTCDVCNHEVQNLPKGAQQEQHEEELDRFDRFGEYVIPVGIVKSLAYFCLLEPLMVWQSGFIVTPLSLLFSPALGFMGSIACSSLVRSKLLWAYAAIHFVYVVLFSLYFINKIPVPAGFVVFLFASLGWVFSICCGKIIDCFAKKRTRKFQDSNRPRVSDESNQLHASPTIRTETSTGHRRTDADIV